MYSTSEREPSSGENSTSSVYWRACATAARTWPLTSSLVVCSLRSMWMSVVLMPLLLVCLADAFSLVGMRLRGRHALFPPKGEEEKEERAMQRHAWWRLAPVPRPSARARAADAACGPGASGYGTSTTLP